ncbi:PGN_0703 family putative restriction endonuclease [Gimesia sp.]|uniref:PGN_0703 family putative restriction endonuclease n=1 Tax=Gimesia sp. TaxID=2024833 RepID=UPI003A91A1D1
MNNSTSFSQCEQEHQISLKPILYSAEACKLGIYNNKPMEIYLRNDLENENLHASIRDQAIKYFNVRNIPWHSVGHLISSQSCCVNLVFPFMQHPDQLKSVLQKLGYPVKEVLPFELDILNRLHTAGWKLNLDSNPREQCPPHYIAFEWIGAKNYLRELRGPNVCGDTTRGRGHRFSSVDFAVRFRQTDGRIQIVMSEWKYTESYPENNSKQTSDTGTDRLERIYRQSLDKSDCQIRLPCGVKYEDLFFDPFDQMMRHQLLTSAMQREQEMGADIVSYLHIAPKANTELVKRITSPKLKRLGNSIYEVWHQLVVPGRFQHCFLEDFLKAAVSHAPNEGWADFVTRRYEGVAASVKSSKLGK